MSNEGLIGPTRSQWTMIQFTHKIWIERYSFRQTYYFIAHHEKMESVSKLMSCDTIFVSLKAELLWSLVALTVTSTHISRAYTQIRTYECTSELSWEQQSSQDSYFCIKWNAARANGSGTTIAILVWTLTYTHIYTYIYIHMHAVYTYRVYITIHAINTLYSA